MNDWRCLVVSPEGRSDWRTVAATDKAGAVAKLAAEGLTPLEIRSGSLSLIDQLNRPITIGGGLRLGEQSLLLTQLAMLIRAGLPVDRSLDLLREQAARGAQRDLLAGVVARVRAGGSLATAIESLGSFPTYVIGVIRAAERGGRLGDALTTLAERMSLAATTRRQLVTALSYPAAVLLATLLAVLLVLTQVIPQFEPIFAGEEARLPSLTQSVLAISRVVSDHSALLVLCAIALPLAAFAVVRSETGSRFVARYRHRIPGLVLRDQFLAAQVTGILGTLLANDVSVVMALPLVRGAVGSAHWQRHLQQVEQRVREGSRLSAALANGGLLPSTAVRLIEVGEQTGKLALTCQQASQIIGEATRARIDRIVSLVNPIAIVTLGGLVGLLVAGVMLGIFALGDFTG
jgi:general secretion pathway protein F